MLADTLRPPWHSTSCSSLKPFHPTSNLDRWGRMLRRWRPNPVDPQAEAACPRGERAEYHSPMPPSIEDVLDQVEALTRRPDRLQDAEERLQGLISTISEADLAVWEEDLRRTISNFHKKRARRLTTVLDERLAGKRDGSGAPAIVQPTAKDVAEYSATVSAFQESLADLSRVHIFQWATYYRELLYPYFDRFLRFEARGRYGTEGLNAVKEALAEHSEEIFTKGFLHVTRTESVPYAEVKSLNGLQRFLDLPLEYYSTLLPNSDPRQHDALRRLTSAMLCGILRGYTAVRFERRGGAQLLPESPNHWAHAIGFLTGADLRDLLRCVGPGTFRDGCAAAVLPLTEALDDLAGPDADYLPAPLLSQIVWEARRLDLSLTPPPNATTRGRSRCSASSRLATSVAPYSTKHCTEA